LGRKRKNWHNPGDPGGGWVMRRAACTTEEGRVWGSPRPEKFSKNFLGQGGRWGGGEVPQLVQKYRETWGSQRKSLPHDCKRGRVFERLQETVEVKTEGKKDKSIAKRLRRGETRQKERVGKRGGNLIGGRTGGLLGRKLSKAEKIGNRYEGKEILVRK